MPIYEDYREDDDEEPDFIILDPDDLEEYELEGGCIAQLLNTRIVQAATLIMQVEDEDMIIVLPESLKQEIAQLIARSIKHSQYNEPLKVLNG